MIIKRIGKEYHVTVSDEMNTKYVMDNPDCVAGFIRSRNKTPEDAKYFAMDETEREAIIQSTSDRYMARIKPVVSSLRKAFAA